MAKLANAGHEKFAQNIAKGMKQEDAFEDAGYTRNNGHASRLKGRPEVKARIAELQAERRAQVPAVASSDPVPMCENPTTLAEMGIDKRWIANAYRAIYDDAKSLGQLNVANTSLAALDKMREKEDAALGRKDEDAPPNKIDINALGTVLDKVAGVIAASKAPDQSASLSVPDQKALRAADAEDEE